MKYDKNYLYNAYNGTSTSDTTGDLETYENSLERQLISRLEKINELRIEINSKRANLNSS